MTEFGGTNCISWVYFKAGIKVPEKYVELPPHTQVLQYFNRISTLEGANAIAAVNGDYAVGDKENHVGDRVEHMAWVENPVTLLQRAARNHDVKEHRIDEFGKLFEYYLEKPELYYVMYLALK